MHDVEVESNRRRALQNASGHANHDEVHFRAQQKPERLNVAGGCH